MYKKIISVFFIVGKSFDMFGWEGLRFETNVEIMIYRDDTVDPMVKLSRPGDDNKTFAMFPLEDGLFC